MNNEKTIDKLKKILVSQLNLKRAPESIGDDEPLFREGLGLDSIDSLEIIIAIEREFGIRIEDEQLKEPAKIFHSVKTLADFVERLLPAK
jgi:acyl carrier protein